MKVVHAGFSKCGTKSMQEAFGVLGFNNYDFPENFDFLGGEWMRLLTGERVDLRMMFEGVDSLTDMPSFYFWDEIHKAFPDSKVR